MRVVIIGQHDFGKAVVEAFLARGDEVVGVFVAPEKEGAKPDSLRVFAIERKIALYQMSSLAGEEAKDTMRNLNVDIGIMAYVLQFVSQEFVNIPKFGTIQYHPSLLPKYRGPSSVNWPMVCGEAETGLTIFRPTECLDKGPVILQRVVPILPDDTLGTLYFERLFPMGVQALLEAADRVVSGNYDEKDQDESLATYEGWLREAESEINWHYHVNFIYNLIRGCDPTPGAWTTLKGKRVQLYQAKKYIFRQFQDIKAAIGFVSEVGENSFKITAHGGEIEIFRVRDEAGNKVPSGDFIKKHGVRVGTKLGD